MNKEYRHVSIVRLEYPAARIDAVHRISWFCSGPKVIGNLQVSRREGGDQLVSREDDGGQQVRRKDECGQSVSGKSTAPSL